MVTDCSLIKLPVGGHGTNDLTSYKVNSLKRVGMAVLLKILTNSADLLKVLHQALSRVADSFDITNGPLLDVEYFLYVVFAFPSIGDINKVGFLLSS
jgi:hypothetical protein